ncbi:MAG: TrmH family RNA methyltransferase [Bacteriovoracia bacterium]
MTKKAPDTADRALEMKIHGLNACLALYKGRPSAIIRLYLSEKRLKVLSDVVRHCVEKKLAYHVVSEEELNEVSGATHHEGVCMVIRRKKNASESELKVLAQSAGAWLALEEVENPHNLGAIVRTAAHFGVKAIFLMGKKSSWQNGAFYRTAEGGAEAVLIYPVDNWAHLLELKTKLGLTLMATSSHKGKNLFKLELPKKALFMMGAEGRGLSPDALKAAEVLLQIPGTNSVESLNVSTATAVFMGEWFRPNS